ncbi:MAG: MBL fold metallo-hydrolase, partial [Gammaproteobacteria bacterium]|nr:MBL fold metallo-hydrolase [Gammaproteobacteria bacterium]
LDRMMAFGPAACCLTHFGKIDRPEERVDMLRESIQAHVDIALEEEERDPEDREARLKAAVDRLLVDAGCAHSDLSPDQVRRIFESDIELNAQGLNVWLIRRAKKKTG